MLKDKAKIRRARLGVNVLPADLSEAFQLASRYNFDFVHADVYTDRVKSRETGAPIHVNLEYVSSFRREFAPQMSLIATIKPWHAYDLCEDEEIEQSALRTVQHGADAFVVVGKDGAPPEVNDINRVRSAVNVPVGAGTGISDETIERYFPIADFFLVSGFFKYNGIKSNPVDPERVRTLVERRG